MLISEQLRRGSIAEYLLYMWQTEDLVRACGCSFQRVREEIVAKFDCTAEEREELTDWYGDIVRMMNKEGKRQGGHLQINEVTLQAMEELHSRLLQSTSQPFYNAAYYKALPFIVELRKKGAAAKGEVETCLEALYGTMLLRLGGKPVSGETEQAVGQIGTLVGLLSDYYKKDKVTVIE